MRPTRRFLCIVIAAAATACSRSPSKNFDRGVTYYKAEDFANAAASFETAMHGSVPTARAWNILGVCRLYTGKTNEAINAFDESL